jgi:predicted lipoprotein with Yx(FWY)xxD motif
MRRNVLMAAALAAVLAAVAIAQAQATRAKSASSSTIALRQTSLGEILVNSSGLTLFDFSRDSSSKDACQSISGCTSAWPPLVTSVKPTAGSGLNASKLATIKLSNGKKQVTYYGRPLYLFSGDKHAGETSYVGVNELGGTWLAVNAKGASVQAKQTSEKQEGSGGW